MATLIRAVEILPPGKWLGSTAVDHLILTYDERHRRRLRYVATGGTTFLLDLPRAAVLRAGDGLRLEDGRIVSVEASPEQLVEVTAPDAGALVRLAWHIGNRHLPAQLEPDRILIRDDAVIVNMLRGLGATVRPVLAAFTPETGAYNSSGTTANQHEHAHAHQHPHDATPPYQHAHGDDSSPQHSHGDQHTHAPSHPGHPHDD
jgi:urease accessory protein